MASRTETWSKMTVIPNRALIGANDEPENSNCGSADANNGDGQQHGRLIRMHEGFIALIYGQRSYLLLCLGDVLQGNDPGQCYQTGARTGRQQV